jgi:hypothetical protein
MGKVRILDFRLGNGGRGILDRVSMLLAPLTLFFDDLYGIA